RVRDPVRGARGQHAQHHGVEDRRRGRRLHGARAPAPPAARAGGLVMPGAPPPPSPEPPPPPSPSGPPPQPATVVVTGGGRGIGRAVALDLAASTQAALVLVSRSETCEAAAAACNARRAGAARALRWDLADWASGAPALAALVDRAAGPLGLVHA